MKFKSDSQRRAVMSKFSKNNGIATVSFDFDGVLAEKVDNMSKVGKPIKPMVVLVKDLHEKGHPMFIYSARLNPRPFRDDTKVDKDAAKGASKAMVEKFLDDNGILECFDHIGYDKKIADIYVDDLGFTYDGNPEEVRNAIGSLRNNFSNRFSLYVDEDYKNVRSTIYPEVDVEVVPESMLNRGLSFDQALNVLGSTPERDFAGVNKVVMVDNTSIGPGEYGFYDKKSKDVAVAVPFTDNPFVDHTKERLSKFDVPSGFVEVNSPAVIVRHEIGHHIDPYLNNPSGSLGERLDVEPFAQGYAMGVVKPGIGEKLDYADALQDQKVITYDDVLRYANEV